MWAVRLLAVRLHEARKNDPTYTPERLRADVETTLAAEGKLYPQATIDEALSAVPGQKKG